MKLVVIIVVILLITPFYKPTIKDLKEDNIICYKDKQFCCEECLEEYKRAHKKSVDISIHIDNSIVQ